MTEFLGRTRRRKPWSPDRQMRVGLVGTESDHAGDFARMLNAEGRHPGFRVTALWGFDTQRNAELAERYGIAMVEAPQALIRQVDAAVITTRDGARHREQALPLIEAGVPLFIDKPLARDVVDAEAILDAAKWAEVPVFSASALRFQPDMLALVGRARKLAPLTAVTTTGTIYLRSEHGPAFYAAHACEMAAELCGGGIHNVWYTQASERELVLTALSGDVSVTIRLIEPAQGESSRFAAEVVSATGTAASEIRLPDDYMAPVVDRFVEMLKTGTPPLTQAEMLAPMRAIETVEDARTPMWLR